MPLRPERVLEVGYDHMEGSRFRHTAQFKRWRPTATPSRAATTSSRSRCRYDLAEVLGRLSGRHRLIRTTMSP